MLKLWMTTHPVLSFTVLIGILTTLGWGMLLSLFGRAPIDNLVEQPMAVPLIYFGAGGPSIAALLLTAYTAGKAGLRQLGRRFIRLRFPLLVWVFALGTPPAMAGLSIMLYTSFSDAMGQRVVPVWYLLIPPSAIVVFFAGPLCEELGWRGYLQPHLLKSRTPMETAVVVGTIWCFWHIPLSFTPGTTPLLGSAIAWTHYWLDAVLMSAIMLAIVVYARGSLLAAMLFHWMSNISFSHIFRPMYPQASETAWVQVNQLHLFIVGLGAVVAVLILIRNPIPRSDISVRGTREIHT